jgi:hypothetical protein
VDHLFTSVSFDVAIEISFLDWYLTMGLLWFLFVLVWSFLEDFLEIDQSETRIACGSHVC